MERILLIALTIIAAAVSAVLLGMLIVSRVRFRKLKASAYTDPASGGFTESGFYLYAGRCITGRASLFALVSMQISEAMYILRNYSTDKYRSFLEYVHSSLKSQLGTDGYIARTGEDTFVFLIQNRRPDEICAKLDNVCDSLNSFDLIGENGNSVFCMKPVFGIYLPENEDENIEDIVQKASNARIGIPKDRRYNFYDREYSEKTQRDLKTAQSMPRAMQTGEFIVYFQPKVRVSDQRVIGAEALIRWRHAPRGIISPDMFLPAAEQFGMIAQIDRYVFEEVCRTLARWQKQNRELCQISVNLSKDSVNRPNLADECFEICSSHGVSPSQIEFEMKEDILLSETDKINALIERFHFHGFRCAIDNFGASLCSMQLLGSSSIDTIKLDRSFFSGGNNNRHGRYLIETILKLAAQMHIRTVAECIDSAGQVEYLRQAACDVIQGFCFFKPMPLEKFENEVFDGQVLKYASDLPSSDSKRNERQEVFGKSSQKSNKSIILFSYRFDDDSVEFSDTFSPVLGSRRSFKNALALFRTTDLIHENDRKDFFALLERCRREDGWVENTFRFYMTQGRYEWLEVRLHRTDNLINGMLADMSGWKNEVNRWKEKATRDALTGLYNREHFEQNTKNILSRNDHSCAAFIFVDVDDFKRVNDTYGHMFGDDVLCFVSKQLLGVFRHTDVIARYGGDEFVVFAPSLDREVLKDRLKKLISTFSYPYRNGGVEYRITVTIGASVYPDDGLDYDTLLDHADCALYEAKGNGKNRFILYEPHMQGDTSSKTQKTDSHNEVTIC